MGILEDILKIVNFDEEPENFELLELERGQPGFFGMNEENTSEEMGKADAFPEDLPATEERIRREFRTDINPDLILRSFYVGGRIRALAVFMNGLALRSEVNDFILRDSMHAELPEIEGSVGEYLIQHVLSSSEAGTETDWENVKMAILDGKTALFLAGEKQAVLLDTRGYEHRSVASAENEKVIRGPQESFNENLRTNITLLRRIIRTEDLVVEFRDAGAKNRIRCGIVYRESLTNPALVEEVKKRLSGIKTDMLLHIGTLEQLMEKYSLSPFPQILSTERPDRAAAQIMQGHVVLLLEGSPLANIMPTTLFTLMASSEDSFLREPQGSILRIVRFTGAFLSVLLPAYFLALCLFHPSLLSAEVLNTIVSSRRMVFVPIGFEMLFLLLVFQLIREAGLRVPGSIGQAIGIIGGLLLGQAAITANLASPVILIIVALSGLGNFCIPDYSMQLGVSYLRIFFVLGAWCGGLLGLSCAFTVFVGYLASMRSYGVPFLAPFAPKTHARRPLIRRGRISLHNFSEDYSNTKGDLDK